jgi:MFS family permease
MKHSNNEPLSISPTDGQIVKLPKPKLVLYFGIVYLLYMFDYAVRVGIAPMMPLIQKDLQLTDYQVGILFAVFQVAVAIFVIPFAYIADRWSKTKMIALMAFAWSCSAALCGWAKSFPVFAAGRFGVGLGEAAYGPAAFSLITSWFNKDKWGKMLGFLNTSQPVGMLVGSIFCGYMAVKIGWRETLYILAVPSIILGLMALIIPDTKEKATVATSQFLGAFKRCMKTKALILSTIAVGFAGAGLTGAAAWFPTYCVRELGMSVPQAGLTTGILALAAIIGFIVGGFLMDMWGKYDIRSRMWIAAIFGPISASFFVLGFWLHNIPLIFAGAAACTVINTCGHVSSQDLVPSWLKALSFGILTVGLFGISFLGPYVVGLVSESFNVRYGLMSLQATYVISTLIFIWAGFNYLKDYERARDEETSHEVA